MAREGHNVLEGMVPIVSNLLSADFSELRVLVFKLRASFLHVFVLFDCTYQASALMPSSLNGEIMRNPNADITTHDYLTPTIEAFRVADALANQLLPAIHPLRLSVKLEYSAFTFDCIRDGDGARRIAKKAIDEAFVSTEALDDDAFEDATHLVGALGVFAKRGLSPYAQRAKYTGTTAESSPSTKLGKSDSRRRSLLEEPGDLVYSTRMGGPLPGTEFQSPKGKERAVDTRQGDHQQQQQQYQQQQTVYEMSGARVRAPAVSEIYDIKPTERTRPVNVYGPSIAKTKSPPGFPPTPPAKDYPKDTIMGGGSSRPEAANHIGGTKSSSHRPITARGGAGFDAGQYQQRFPPAVQTQATSHSGAKHLEEGTVIREVYERADLTPNQDDGYREVYERADLTPIDQFLARQDDQQRNDVPYTGGSGQDRYEMHGASNYANAAAANGHNRSSSINDPSLSASANEKRRRSASEAQNELYVYGMGSNVTPVVSPHQKSRSKGSNNADPSRSPLIPGSNSYDNAQRRQLPQQNLEQRMRDAGVGTSYTALPAGAAAYAPHTHFEQMLPTATTTVTAGNAPASSNGNAKSTHRRKGS